MKREENTLYLVTGAAGFLGGHVCRQLLERGDRVRAFVLPKDPAAKYLPKDVEIVEGDLCDRESLEPFFSVEEGTKTICIHVASMVTVDPDFIRSSSISTWRRKKHELPSVWSTGSVKSWSMSAAPGRSLRVRRGENPGGRYLRPEPGWSDGTPSPRLWPPRRCWTR